MLFRLRLGKPARCSPSTRIGSPTKDRHLNHPPTYSLCLQHVYEVCPRPDHRGVDLISDALPFGRLWYEAASAAVDYAKHSSRSHDAVIRVYNDAGNVIETHEHKGDFKEW